MFYVCSSYVSGKFYVTDTSELFPDEIHNVWNLLQNTPVVMLGWGKEWLVNI